MASAPVVDEVGALHAEALSDLGSAYEVIDVDLLSHARTLGGSPGEVATYRPQRYRYFCDRSYAQEEVRNE
jgi:hypothetical protein